MSLSATPKIPHDEPDSRVADQSGSDTETLNNAETDSKNDDASPQLEKDRTNEGALDESPHGTRRDLVPVNSRKKLHLEQINASGPSKLFNPTNARFRIRWKDDEDGFERQDRNGGRNSIPGSDAGSEVSLRWSSRYNRKGRNSFIVSRSSSLSRQSTAERTRENMRRSVRILKNIVRMFATFPYWDMAFWSGWAYTWGSVLFIFDGAFSWIPEQFPWTTFSGELDSVGYFFFFGALFFQVGATVAYLEAINDGSFHGSAMRRFLEGHENDQKKLLDEKLLAFFGHLVPISHSRKARRRQRRIGRLARTVDLEAGWDPENKRKLSESLNIPRRGGVDFGTLEEGQSAEYLPWRWWPTWQNFKSHHIREIGWWACAIQLFGATVYGMCGIVALPGILNHLQQWQENAAYWIPQIVASVCFVLASLLFTLETQDRWYKPEPKVLGWWVGFWATVGSFGFLLSGALGPAYGSRGAQIQSDLSSFWGSWAFLFSALLQWYEAVNKHPIEELLNEPGHMKSFQVHPI